MTSPSSRSPLASLAADEYVRYFAHLADRVETALRSVPAESIWTKPFPFGNSIGHLVLHLTGNLSHFIGAEMAATGYIRDREREFTSSDHPPLEELLHGFRDAVAVVIRTLRTIDDAGFMEPVDKAPIQSKLGMFLICASHINNHLGQMSYLVQALQPGAQPKPSW